MTENFSWSANAGRWMGIPVRIHLFLVLFVATIFGIEITFSSSAEQIGVGTGLITVLILLASILVHELAHVFAITSIGGQVKKMVLMPWGGNSDFALTHPGRSRGIIYLAGPFVNGVIFALFATVLIQSDHAELIQLTNPFHPHEFEISQWQVSLVRITTWVNFQLMLVNLIPCFPFDGAAIVRSIITGMNTDLPKLRIESAIMVMGHAVAFTLIGLAWLVRDYNPGPIQPAWMIMMLGGITLIFAARHSFYEETRIKDAEWDDSGDMDYDSFYDEQSNSIFDFPTEHENTAYSQWLTEKQEARMRDELRREADEDRRADEILKKLHGGSLSNLTDDERSVLDRVSARIRRRRQQGVQ